MKRFWMVSLFVGILLLVACQGTQPTPTTTPFESPLGLPNPASQHCEQQGYQWEVRTAADGSQTGYCLFPDGTECEEWSFYRGECAPGTPRP